MDDNFIENENLCILLKSFAEWLVNNRIPQANTRDNFLEASTKVKYWGELKDSLKEKFWDHEGWKKFEDDWCASIKDAITKESKRAEFEKGTDSQDHKFRAIYLNVEHAFICFHERCDPDWTNKEGRDLFSIIKTMMIDATLNNQMFEQRCILLRHTMALVEV